MKLFLWPGGKSSLRKFWYEVNPTHSDLTSLTLLLSTGYCCFRQKWRVPEANFDSKETDAYRPNRLNSLTFYALLLLWLRVKSFLRKFWFSRNPMHSNINGLTPVLSTGYCGFGREWRVVEEVMIPKNPMHFNLTGLILLLSTSYCGFNREWRVPDTSSDPKESRHILT